MVDLKNAIYSSLKQEGLKLTKTRVLLIELIVKNRKTFISARTLHQEAKLKYPNISADTIYKTLFLLEKKGYIEKKGMWDRECKYQLVAETNSCLIKCLICGKNEWLEKSPIDLNIDNINEKFKLQRFEFYGYCTTCIDE